MSDNTVDLTPAAQRLADLVARVRDDELSGPTPCPAYTLGDLIEHIGGMALAFRAAAEKDIASPYAERSPAGDAALLPADWRAGSRATSPRWPRPGRTRTRGPG